eukprot:COSAG01_NODE_3706_length_5768_cov_41.859584_3_plen_116_part_00
MAGCPAAQSLCADAYAFAGTMNESILHLHSIVPGDGGGGGGGPMANGGHADHPQPPEMEPSAVEPLESPPTVLTPPPTPAGGEEEEEEQEEEVEVEEVDMVVVEEHGGQHEPDLD